MTGQPPTRPQGFLNELRSQHWLVKLVLIGVAGALGSPFIGLFLFAVHAILGGFGIFLGGVALLLLAAWFLGSQPPVGVSLPQSRDTAVDLRRFCPACGERMSEALAICPACAQPMPPPADPAIATLAATLNDLAVLFASGQIDAASYSQLRHVYETRLDALRPLPAGEPELAAPPVAAPESAEPEPPPPVALAHETPPPRVIPREPATPIAERVAGWAAERQADILLYLGAFLISMAAIIFVAYQGEAVSPVVRVAILTAYTVAFIVLGLTLHRWEQAREAGPIFLALGAILVPIVGLAALRVDAFEEEGISSSILWLVGSLAATVLYALLTWRGYGRYYVVPAILGALVAWGSLAAVLDLPPEWFGAWYQVAALVIYVYSARTATPFARWIRLAGGALAAGALVFAIAAAGEDQHRWQLPATLTLATALPSAALYFRRSTVDLALLPLLAAAAAASVHWAASDPDFAWYDGYLAAVGVAYVAIAALDTRLRGEWRALAFVPFGAAMALAFAATLNDGPQFVLPVAAAITTLGIGAGVLLWRLQWRSGLACLPPLLATTVGSLSWAWFDMPAEWSPAWATGAAVGYLAVAELDAVQRRWWQASAHVLGAVALLAAFLAAVSAESGSNLEFVLPLALGIAALGTVGGVLRWRLDWRPGVATLSPLVAAAVGSLAWAWFELPPRWTAPWIATAAVGYLLTAAVDTHLVALWRRSAIAVGLLALFAALVGIAGVERGDPAEYILSSTLGLMLLGTIAGVARWRLSWREGLACLPPLAASSAGAFLWAAIEMSPVWTGAWIAAVAAGYILIAELDPARRLNWRGAALSAVIAALGAGHIAAGRPQPLYPAQLPLTYGILSLASIADAYRRRDWGLLFPPVLLAGLGATSLWAADVGPEWWAFPSLAISVAVVATARWWRHSPTAAATVWTYAAALATVPTLVSLGVYAAHPGYGLAAALVTAIVLGACALRSAGAVSWAIEHLRLAVEPWDRRLARTTEQATFCYAAAAFVIAAGGYFNDLQSIQDAGRAWIFLSLGSVAWLVSAAAALKWRVAPVLGVPPALAACSLAAGLASGSPGTATIVLAVAAVLPAFAFAATRFPPFWLASAIYAGLTIWAFWTWAELPEWSLSGAYVISALVVWLALWGARRYGRIDPVRDSTVHALSWVPWLVSGGVAWSVLAARSESLDPGQRLQETPEWGMAVAILAGASVAVISEGWRLHRRYVQQIGTVGLLASLLMAIAIGDPANVQAYTAPVGLYIVGTALAIRRSDPLFGRHMDLHEGLMVLGVLFIVLPPAQQGFQPGGELYGFELIGIGLGFLIFGLLIHARWLIPCGVLTVSGVAIRWLTGGFVAVPYWLLLGIVGTALLAFGTFILLQRERWDSWRNTVQGWWLHTATQPQADESPSSTP
ncbi:MAG: hypothetical protein R3C29_10820 [Dehalococcoidia bacterium]